MKTLLAAIFAAMLIAAIAACGSSSSGGGGAAAGDPKSLAGTWGGSYYDRSLDYTLTFNVDSSGAVTSVFLGGVSQNQTGTIAGVAGYPLIFTVTFSNGDQGAFMTDASGTHLFFADTSLYMATLQKGASGATDSYSITQLAGSWSGNFATVDDYYDLSSYGTASATVSGTSFTGSDSSGLTFNGNSLAVNGLYGRVTGNFSNSAGQNGTFYAVLSLDKTFLGSVACPGGGYYASNCGYNMWTK
jgi:hypothetical protein